MTRLLGSMVTLVALLGGMLAASAGPAAAAGCGGALIGRKAMVVNGATVGELVVYYNAATGNNCARMNHLGAAYGVKRYTGVWINKCAQTSRGHGCTILTADADWDYYRYYAGPAVVHAPRNCVTGNGQLHWGGKVQVVKIGPIGC